MKYMHALLNNQAQMRLVAVRLHDLVTSASDSGETQIITAQDWSKHNWPPALAVCVTELVLSHSQDHYEPIKRYIEGRKLAKKHERLLSQAWVKGAVFETASHR
eukprot:6020210-Pyramimonas_sp.AAC.1